MNQPQFEARMAELKAKMHEYHAAIGRLMLKWAETELLIYKVLLHYANLREEVGRALLSGTRAKGLTEFILAIAENTNMDSQRHFDLKVVFAQITTINTMRDRIVHNGMWSFASVDGKYAQQITNMERSSRGKANMFWVEIDAAGIDAMVNDLSTIGQHLSRHVQPEFHPYRTLAESSTWLYKSPQPVGAKGKSPKAGRE